MVDYTATLTKLAYGSVDVITTIIVTLVILLVLGLLAWYIYYRSQFKHKVAIYDQISGDGLRVIEDKFRIFKDKDGAFYAQFWKSKHKLSEPPAESKKVLDKKSYFCECVKLGETKYQWLDIRIEKRKADGKNILDSTYEPINSTDRQLMTHEYMRSLQEKSSGMGELLKNIAPFLSVIIILVMALLIFDSTLDKINSFAEFQVGIASAQLENQKEVNHGIELVRDIVQNKQNIDVDWAFKNVTLTPPPN